MWLKISALSIEDIIDDYDYDRKIIRFELLPEDQGKIQQMEEIVKQLKSACDLWKEINHRGHKQLIKMYNHLFNATTTWQLRSLRATWHSIIEDELEIDPYDFVNYSDWVDLLPLKSDFPPGIFDSLTIRFCREGGGCGRSEDGKRYINSSEYEGLVQHLVNYTSV